MQYQYDALGQVILQTDARNIQTHFAHDLAGRLIERRDDYQSSNEVLNQWLYDTQKIGLLTQRQNPGFIETYQYNSLTQLTDIDTDIDLPTLDKSYHTDFTYDDYGRPGTQTFPSGFVGYNTYNVYGYNEALHENSAGGQVLSRVDDTNDFGNVTQSTLGNVTTHRTFDEYGRVTAISSLSGSLQNHTYNWWSNGLLHQRTRGDAANAAETFVYDGLNRLSQAYTQTVFNSRSLDYDYDLLGNLTNKRDSTLGMDVDNYAHNASNPYQLDSVTVNGVSHSYDYDASGNVVTISASGDGEKTLAYNAIGKPVDVRKGNLNGGVIDKPRGQDQFEYDPDGARFYKRSINEKIGIVMMSDITVIWPRPTVDQTLYLLGGSFEVIFPAEGANVAIEKSYAGDVIHIREVTLSDSTSHFEYVHTDHLGSVDVITDVNGAELLRNQFDPFGYRRSSNWTGVGSAPNMDSQNVHSNRGYTGHEQLDSTGLIHMNGRVYDPTIGRFMSADPIVQAPNHSQSYNRYAYVFNNPINFSDPSGYECVPTNGESDCGDESDSSFQEYTGWRSSLKYGYCDFFCWHSVWLEAQDNRQEYIEAMEIHQAQYAAEAAAARENEAAPGWWDRKVERSAREVMGLDTSTYNGNYWNKEELQVFLLLSTGAGQFPGSMAITAPRIAVAGTGYKAGVALDLFGGEASQLARAINVDLKAIQGVRASSEALPFANASVVEIVASGPQAPFLAEAARVLQPGGKLFINSTRKNPYGAFYLPTRAELQALNLRIIEPVSSLHPRFSGQVFRFSDGNAMRESVKQYTVILEKVN